MEFAEVVRRRRMWRNFTEDPIDPDALERILAVAVRAPSAGFSQGWGFLALTEEADRARFWDIEWPADERDGPHTTVMKAPALVIPFSNKHVYLDRYAEPDKGWTDRDEGHWPVPFWHIDTGFAAMLMMLAAVDEGLGTLFFGVRQAAAVRKAFGIPDAFTPIGALAIGHPAADTPSPSLQRGRKPVDEVVHRGRW